MRAGWYMWWLCGAPLPFGGSQPPAAAPPAVLNERLQVPIDRIVAVIDKEVLTHSRLLMEARLSLCWRQGAQAAQTELTPQLLGVLSTGIIDQMLIAAQARRLGSSDISEEQTALRMATLVQRFGSQASYDAFVAQYGITQEVVHDTLARDLRCEQYMQQRMRTRLLGSTQQTTVQPERYAAAVRLWLEELRQSAEVRLEGPDSSLELERSRTADRP